MKGNQKEKMKTQKIIALISAMVFCLGMLAMPTAASTYMEYEGLSITVEMDQDSYDANEPITATITVTNTNDQTVTIVSLEQLIPEGYVLAEDSVASLSNFAIQSGQTITLQVTFTAETDQTSEGEEDSESFFDTLLYGFTWGIPNILLAFILVVVFIIFMILT